MVVKVAPASDAMRVDLPAPDDTARLGRTFAAATVAHAAAIAAHGLQVNLEGDLGVGKTTLVRAWLRALGIGGTIRSPSFSVVETYVVPLHQSGRSADVRLEAQEISSLDFYHIDFYRFADPEEFSAGFRELFGPGAICAVEWPARAGGRLPAADITVALRVEGEGRRAALSAASELGDRWLLSAMENWRAGAAG